MSLHVLSFMTVHIDSNVSEKEKFIFKVIKLI